MTGYNIVTDDNDSGPYYPRGDYLKVTGRAITDWRLDHCPSCAAEAISQDERPGGFRRCANRHVWRRLPDGAAIILQTGS